MVRVISIQRIQKWFDGIKLHSVYKCMTADGTEVMRMEVKIPFYNTYDQQVVVTVVNEPAEDKILASLPAAPTYPELVQLANTHLMSLEPAV